ncbi:uncharacterized protein LOC132277857 [Cornus florida]|uniref:uncharacterized protein LOC132277857 n=1 Tax=Cornus florida TaxID=4283 RepID=UPI00289B7902|nr:uncharacterized protein LOC132277857 [Cornus florida]
MEIFNAHRAFVILSVLTSFSFFLLPGCASSLAGTIERTSKQQVLASLPPSHETMPTYGSSQQFLTSPSAKYAAFLVRTENSIGGGGFGNDFCYIQVQQSGQSVWESECTSVSNADTCTLVFSDAGLELFEGSHSAWDTGADDEHLQTLDLLDGGDMEIRDKDGKLVWKTSNTPSVNQNCGYLGTPGIAPAIEKQSLGNQEVGYTQQSESQNQPFSSSNKPFSSCNRHFPGFNQPLVSNKQPFGTNNQQGLRNKTPFDRGVSVKKKFSARVALVSLISLMFAF